MPRSMFFAGGKVVLLLRGERVWKGVMGRNACLYYICVNIYHWIF